VVHLFVKVDSFPTIQKQQIAKLLRNCKINSSRISNYKINSKEFQVPLLNKNALLDHLEKLRAKNKGK
jgi:hypothetical protein